MNKEKRSSIVLAIFSIVFAAAAGVTLYFTLKQGFNIGFSEILDRFKGIGDYFKAMIDFKSIANVKFGFFPYLLVFYCVIALAALAWVIIWIIHLILLIAKRRPSALFPNIVWLLLGAASIVLAFSLVAMKPNGSDFEGFLFGSSGGAYDVVDCFSFIKLKFDNNEIVLAILAIAAVATTVLTYLFALLTATKSIKDVVRHPGVKKVKESAIAKDNENTYLENEQDFAAGEGEVDDDAIGDDFRSYQYAELGDQKKAKGGEKEGKTPLIVQNISYAAPQKDGAKAEPPHQPPYPPYPPYPYAPYPYAPYPYYPFPPFGAEPAKKEETKKEEPKAPEATPNPAAAERPLTAKELRAIVQEELNDHDHPEELDPLTDEQARTLIKEELQKYYAGTPAEEPVEEEKPVVEEPIEEDEELMTSDDLRDLIKETVQNVLAEQEPKEEEKPAPVETLSADEIRQVVAQELEKQPKPEEGIKADEIRQVVSEELEKQPKPEEGIKADDVRSIVREELEASKVEPTDSETVIATKDMVAENNAQIKEAAEKQLTGDEVRTLIAEELAKYFEQNKVFVQPEPAPEEPKEEKPVEPEPVPAPEPEPEPEPVVTEPVPEEASSDDDEDATPAKAAVVRVPFAERVLNMDEDTKDSYNELKAEALAYGLKSRISNSGDTFRLHTKTYLKLTVAGKGLKLYFALDPKDYRDTPIPVKDVGAKNIYKDIPLCFKVKSALSLKRAKQLIADAAAKDHLEKGEATPYDYVAQLRDYHESKDDEEE